ncbi:hypothetical protein A1355_07385 [Methylomonas koyamae]|uniref:Uncharacterized protein n=1 Tax=Methylomonas koyamae TaxID=702114 RepID=A0A177NKA1_9GAMM|nr:hypothetical protein A1355_07385 [Methylomonas koyamae]
MNTIHSSSLAFYPTGYQKPSPDNAEQNRSRATLESNTGKPPAFVTKPSEPATIDSVLTKNPLGKNDEQDVIADPKARKALNAYSQTINQSNRQRVAELVTGIDLYA